MTRSILKIPLLTLLAAPGLMPLLASDGRIPISAAPYFITTPGVYYLTRDLTVASGTAITINPGSGPVNLDLNGHTVTNSNTAAGTYAIAIDVTFAYSLRNVRVTNGQTVGGGGGVFLFGSTGSDLMVDHVVASGAGIFGISLSGITGGSFKATVDSVRVTGPATTAGIALDGVSGGRISGSQTQGCFNGMQLTNSRGVIIENNTVSESGQYGIYLIGNSGIISRDNLITGNTVQKSTSSGIILVGARGNRIVANVASVNFNGIEIDNANDNTVSDNVLTENGNFGIYVTGISNSQISRNNITGTQGVGNGIQLLSSTYNTVDGNISAGNVGAGLLLGSGATANIYSNNRLPNNVTGNNFGSGNFSAGGNNAGAAANF